MNAQLDHLVVLAHTLQDGVAWCVATLGVSPGPGGRHALMGTHNRLLSIASEQYPSAYCEIIAIDPQAATPAQKRWFNLDDAALQNRLRSDGPQLLHWVARVPDIAGSVAALQALGLEPGPVLSASRATARGLLQWQITVRADGQLLLDGLLPSLIQWGQSHPWTSLPACALALQAVELQHPQAAWLQQACAALGWQAGPVLAGPARLRARLQTPRGLLELGA